MSPQEFRSAANALRNGAVIAYPTEGVWGLGCDPANQRAVSKILELKQRPVEKGVILVTDLLPRLSPFFETLPDPQNLLTEGRPITWLLSHGGLAPDWLSGGRETLAIRLSEHPVITGLCAAAEMPLVSTSANPSGESAATSAEEVQSYFGNLIDVIVPGATGGQNGASEIRDYRTGKVLREAGE